MKPQTPKVCVAHPGLKFGGSEAKAMTILEVLQDRYDTTLVTGAPFDCARLNNAHHTNVDERRINVRIAPMPRFLRDAQMGDALRGAFFARFLKAIGNDFDLCISTYNFAEFGRRSLQIVADFSWDDEIRREFDPVSPGLRGFLQRPNPARWAYLAVADLIRGGHHDLRKHADDIVIANSQWSADLLAHRHGLRSRVLYPPVHAPPQRDTKRSNDFVMLGRISPEKRVIEAIDILRRVRERGHEFEFHIIGPLDKSAYCNQLRERAQRYADWVHLRGGLYGDEKFEELGRHAFGLHVRRREAFGIVVAEMVEMGLVPFVSMGSAPTEVVQDDRVAFSNPKHAVDVIDRVLRNPNELASVRKHLAGRANLFSVERFVRDVRRLIDEALEERQTGRAAIVTDGPSAAEKTGH